MSTGQKPLEEVPGKMGCCDLREIRMPEGGTFALITVGSAAAAKPAVLSPDSLQELGSLLASLRQRAASGEFIGVGVTGKAQCFVAGADLTVMREVRDSKSAREIAASGHDVFSALADMEVPTFAFINGAAIGGGLELALAAQYRSISHAVKAVSLPEAFLGLVPGWGGVYRLPRLIGPVNAVKVMIENALNNNRVLNGLAAFELGIADRIFEADEFLEQSLAWASAVIAGDEKLLAEMAARRQEKSFAPEAEWIAAIAHGRAVIKAKTSNATPAPSRVLSLMRLGRNLEQPQSAALEIDTLTELILTPEFKNTVYAFLDLLRRRAKLPAATPGHGLARPVGKVGILGAGLMAGQLALIFASKLKVPVVLTDLDQARVDAGVERVHAQVDRLLVKNRLNPGEAARLKGLVSGSVNKDAFADADFVIEAVFEELSVKKQVFAEVEAVVSAACILATNTSSLSVTKMGSDLLHPERLVGFHFFNPVAAMPLLEIVQTPQTSDDVLATAFATGQTLGKTTVLVQDSAAFVVNRVLLRLMNEIFAAFDEGSPADIADHALDPMGLPMTPFDLLAMIGLPVSLHVTRSLNTSFGERFQVSANQQRLVDHGVTSVWTRDEEGRQYIAPETLKLLKFGDSPSSPQDILVRAQNALAQEIGLILDEGVVPSAEDVDLCMLTGAGWPMHLGGITPYLDQVGASQRVLGRRFHPNPEDV